MKILVVEDDDAIRDALADILEFEDYYVHTEANGVNALEWLRHNPRPSVILLDLMMPVMDGFEFREHQLKDPDLATIPVIVITASRFSPEMYAHFDAVLLKPLSIDTLAEKLRSIPIATDPRFDEITQRFVIKETDK